MTTRWALCLFLASAIPGCVTYEYEHEFWLDVEGSGTVYVTGTPDLWAAFKGLAVPGTSADARAAARTLFERSGLRVTRVTLTRRAGRQYLFVAAEFDDINRLPGTPAFPDLLISLHPQGERLALGGSWSPPQLPSRPLAAGPEDLMAVRFHLPSKVYSHRNAFGGVERGNIVGWRQTTRQALAGTRLPFEAIMDQRSILLSTVRLFGAAIGLAGLTLATALYLVVRRGRKRLQQAKLE